MPSILAMSAGAFIPSARCGCRFLQVIEMEVECLVHGLACEFAIVVATVNWQVGVHYRSGRVRLLLQ